jgi:phage tail sheath gpL-like
MQFNQFPANWKLPLFWAEVDPSKAGLPVNNLPALLVGTRVGGTAPVDVPIAISTQAQADDAFGQGSQLARMFTAFFKNNFAHEVWGLPIAEPGAGVKATGTITVSGTATADGVLYVYIAGQRVAVSVAATDTAAEVAAALSAAINDVDDLPVTAALQATDSPQINLTCRWKGTTGNDIDLRDSYRGVQGGEKLPTGIAVAYSNSGKLSGGTGAPVMTTAIANIGDEAYEYVALAFLDATSKAAWADEYGFSDTGRWGWMRQTYGHLFGAYRDTYANLMVYGPTNNEGVLAIGAIEQNMPTPSWEVAAAYTAKAARALLNDPARPLQTLELSGVLPAPKHQRFSKTELNNLAGSGLSTFAVGASGVPVIMRETTTYQRNPYSQGDDAYELVTTLATLAALLRDMAHAVTSKYPRHKLADDGTRFGPGQAIVTPKIIKAELIAEYREQEFLGRVENVAAFKKNLIVERDVNNPNRISVLYPPDLVNQLRIFAVLAQFRLQYDRGVDQGVA